MGPLAYDVAMEETGGLGLISDRDSVSPAARAVWDYYLNNRPDVEAEQLDDLNNTLTPDDKDNCSQRIASYTNQPPMPKVVDFQTSPLSKLYKKSGTPVMDELRKRGMLDA